MRKIKLRPYQLNAIKLIRGAYKETNKILVQSPTGSGKTEIIFSIINGYLKNEKKVLFVVRRRQIVFQTVRRIVESGISNVGIIMSGKTPSPIFPVQVCSIDTIHSKIKRRDIDFIKKFDAIFMDEAHDTTSDSYRSFIWWLEGKEHSDYNKPEFLDLKVKKDYFGFTATPYRIGKKTHEWWGKCIVVTTPDKLRDLGYLCEAKLYVPLSISTKGVKIENTGDYNQEQLYEAVSKKAVMGKIVDEYIHKGERRPAVCFAVNKKHSIEIAKFFNDLGIEAYHVEDTTSQEDRDFVIRKVKNAFYERKPFVICNVNIFSTGVDIPELCVGIMARPTESRVLWTQQLGRLLRPLKGKDKAVIIDHSGNSLRFGSPFHYHPPEMGKESFDKPSPISICPKCYYYHDKIVSVCEACGTHIKSYLKTLRPGEERHIEKDESFMMGDYEKLLELEIKDYVHKNVRYELEVKKKSEKEAWSRAYKKFGVNFLKVAEKVGCPDYVVKGLKKEGLLKSAMSSKIIFGEGFDPVQNFDNELEKFAETIGV